MSRGETRNHADTQAQASDTERVLRRRPVTREHHCVAVESRAEAGQALRLRRKDVLDITQAELAIRSDVGLSSVQRLEQGRRIDRAVERKIARGLGWTEDSIDLVFAGQPPVESSGDQAWSDSFVDEVRAMTHEEMARRAAWVSHVTGDPAEGDRVMAGMLRIRRAGGTVRNTG